MTPAELLARADALLVDLDGTLVDSTAPVRRAWGAFAGRHGLDVDEVYRFAQGRPSRDTIRLLASHRLPTAVRRCARCNERLKLAPQSFLNACAP
jgi:sugar-phosphatase